MSRRGSMKPPMFEANSPGGCLLRLVGLFILLFIAFGVYFWLEGRI